MRIVAGTFRGRPIDAPAGRETRPTSDRVREALFSSLDAQTGGIGAAVVLDAFAGSGALGLEALSRGADRVTFAERDRHALATLRTNVAALGVGASARLLAGDVLMAARRGRVPGGPFTLLFLDPPYRIDTAAVQALLGDLVSHEALSPGAVAVWEHASREAAPWPEGWSEIVRKVYGTTAVSLARLTTEDGRA